MLSVFLYSSVSDDAHELRHSPGILSQADNQGKTSWLTLGLSQVFNSTLIIFNLLIVIQNAVTFELKMNSVYQGNILQCKFLWDAKAYIKIKDKDIQYNLYQHFVISVPLYSSVSDESGDIAQW